MIDSINFHGQYINKPSKSGGWLYCGICLKAKEQLCDTWRQGKKTHHDCWVTGTQDWDNFSRQKKWKIHAMSNTHEDSINFLMSRDQNHIVNDIDKQSKGQLEQCQIQNRYFFARGVMKSITFLGKNSLPFYGKTSGEGFGELLKHIGNEYVPMLKKSLQANKKSKLLVRPMHHADVSFVLKRCCQQIRRF